MNDVSISWMMSLADVPPVLHMIVPWAKTMIIAYKDYQMFR